MQRLLFAVLAFAIACVQAPTALPQTVPISERWVTTTGDTITAVGSFSLAVVVNRAPAETIPKLVVDTLWCTPAGVCSETPPVPPSDTILPVPVGVPFGPYNLAAKEAPFSLSIGSVSPGALLYRIAAARAGGFKLLTNFTGGSHENYMTNGVFDRRKWKARVDSFATPAIKAAVAQAVAEGVLVGNNVMDEPHVTGGGDGNTWGPAGTMNKARVDSLCADVRRHFPTLPTGVVHPATWLPTQRYRSCQWLGIQYASRLGSAKAWLAEAQAIANRDSLALVISINVLNGGKQDRDGVWDCPWSRKGTYTPNCWMTSPQLLAFADTVLWGCAAGLWRHEPAYVSANAVALNAVAAKLATRPRKSCRR